MLNLNKTVLLTSFEESDELSAADLRACVGGTDLSGISVGVSGASGLVDPVRNAVPVKVSAKAPVGATVDHVAGAIGITTPNVSVS